jgi:hypothetical protein
MGGRVHKAPVTVRQDTTALRNRILHADVHTFTPASAGEAMRGQETHRARPAVFDVRPNCPRPPLATNARHTAMLGVRPYVPNPVVRAPSLLYASRMSNPRASGDASNNTRLVHATKAAWIARAGGIDDWRVQAAIKPLLCARTSLDEAGPRLSGILPEVFSAHDTRHSLSYKLSPLRAAAAPARAVPAQHAHAALLAVLCAVAAPPPSAAEPPPCAPRMQRG